MPFLIGIYSWL